MAQFNTNLRSTSICAFVALIAGVLHFMTNENTKSESIPELRLPFRMDLSPEASDPARIVHAATWGYLENLTSTLIEWDKNGQLIAGIAESFMWEDNALHLKIRSNYRTVDGFFVSADDVAFSLKRVIVLARNTHGFLADFLCGDKRITSPDDECDGIAVSGSTLILKPTEGRGFLTKMLTSMDFAVLLRKEIDPKTLAIKSFRNTTGPYYLDEAADGSFMYLPNKNHWHYSEKMPQKIRLVPVDFSAMAQNPTLTPVFERFLDGNIDIINNDASDRADLYVRTAQDDKGLELSRTMDIGRTVAVFTPRGIKEIPQNQRRYLAKTIKRLANSILIDSSGARKETMQFFTAFGDGALSDQQISELDEVYRSEEEEIYEGALKIALSPSLLSVKEALEDGLPRVKISQNIFEYLEGKTPSEEHPHMYIGRTDTSWSEDLGLLAYSISMRQFFPESQDEGRDWLRKYIGIEDKNARLGMLRDLHLRALSEPWIVPLASEGYYTLVRKPWTYQGPTLFASGALWHLRHP